MKSMNEIISWSGYNWLTRERWGSIHPEKPYNWYDPSAIKIHNDQLCLNIHKNPRSFTINKKQINSPFGTGLVTCESDFGFGKFEIEAKLPKGKGLWPAFWMWAVDEWPPEIDIFEGYSGLKGNYYKHFIKPVNVKSCVHLRDEWNTRKICAKAPWIIQFNKKPYKEFHIYSCVWTNDKLEFYIDNKRIRKIRDKKILGHIARYKMKIIINNHIDGKYISVWNIESPFVINYFKYEPL